MPSAFREQRQLCRLLQRIAPGKHMLVPNKKTVYSKVPVTKDLQIRTFACDNFLYIMVQTVYLFSCVLSKYCVILAQGVYWCLNRHLCILPERFAKKDLNLVIVCRKDVTS